MSKLTYSEIDAQPYRDTRLSAGILHGHKADTIYLKFEREGEEPTIITLRRDEALRIAALLCNALWSEALYPARKAKK